MAGKAKYLMIATMDIDTEHEAIFNEVYDKEHVPNLSKVPGVIGITRYKRGTLKMNIGGETNTIEITNEPAQMAINELAKTAGFTRPGWRNATIDRRWAHHRQPLT